MAKFVISKAKVLEKYEEARALADMLSYSSKTNQQITPILEENTDCLFSVHFENELKHIKDMSRVIFLAQALDKKRLDNLLKLGIRWFIVDNTTDLDFFVDYLDKHDISGKIADRSNSRTDCSSKVADTLHHNNSDERSNNKNNIMKVNIGRMLEQREESKINLLLRMKIKEATVRTEKYFVFGMKADIINEKIKELRNNENINKLGIHFHIKTQNMAEWNIQYLLEEALTEETLQAIDLVNTGGGLPSIYANTNDNVLPSIKKKITELRTWLSEYKVKTIIEPGRFIAAEPVKLVTTILMIHDNEITVDASVYNSDMDALVVPVKLLVENELKDKEGKPYVIKGLTPCSLDLFRYRVYLKNPKVGDELVFINAGAYNFTTDFCDLEKIPSKIIK